MVHCAGGYFEGRERSMIERAADRYAAAVRAAAARGERLPSLKAEDDDPSFADPVNYWEQATNNAGESNAHVPRSTPTQRNVEKLENEIAVVEDQLVRAQAGPFPDAARIHGLEAHLAELQRVLRQLQGSATNADDLDDEGEFAAPESAAFNREDYEARLRREQGR